MKLAVPNAILFVTDPESVASDFPLEHGGLVSHTDGCVCVGTQADVDGETEVSIGRVEPEGLTRVFDGFVKTASGAIGVETSERLSLGLVQGLSREARVTVWVDHTRWPSRVAVVVGR